MSYFCYMKSLLQIACVLLAVFPDLLWSQERYALKAPKLCIELVVPVAKTQVGVREIGRNAGYDVEKYLKSVGLRAGDAYCASGIYWCWTQAFRLTNTPLNRFPLPKTGLAYNMFKYAKKNGVQTKYEPRISDLIDWKFPDKVNGHIEMIVKTKANGWVQTVGFNTGKTTGNDGEGVFYKTRNVYTPLGRMQIMGLVGFTPDE